MSSSPGAAKRMQQLALLFHYPKPEHLDEFVSFKCTGFSPKK